MELFLWKWGPWNILSNSKYISICCKKKKGKWIVLISIDQKEPNIVSDIFSVLARLLSSPLPPHPSSLLIPLIHGKLFTWSYAMGRCYGLFWCQPLLVIHYTKGVAIDAFCMSCEVLECNHEDLIPLFQEEP